MDKRKWIVTSAWPYVNATPHLGNMIGSVLSADVFARYVRMKGDEVVFVSGSDEHGTPVAVSAMEQNLTPEELTKINHAKIKSLFEQWQISYDNYTHTHNPVHMKFTQDFYEQVNKNGYVYTQSEKVLYCAKDKLYLPDRFVEGICPFCGSDRARGDQCNKCDKLLTPDQLKEPHCRHCKSTPELRETKHWYMNFPKVQQEIAEFVKNNPYIPDNARTCSLNSIENGLPGRAITRDLAWGIPATFPDSEGKSIYVWFEAVLGYISAVKEWAENIKKQPELFSQFWNDAQTKTVYFIGKDNIIFHLIIFPGLLLAYNKNLPDAKQFIMPYNVSSTEFLNMENEKFSKSQKVGIWIDQALELASVEYWRYNLIRNRPEKADTSFMWSTFEHDVLEMNDIMGNFIHRVVSFIEKNYNSQVPEAPKETDLDEEDKKIIALIKEAPKRVGDFLEKFALKDALNEVVLIARDGNVYINNKAPWKMMKVDKRKAGYTFNLSIQLVHTLGVILAPFIPNISEQILKLIGCSQSINTGIWDSAGELLITDNQQIAAAKPLFAKLDIPAMKKKLDDMNGVVPKASADSTEEKIPLIDYATFEKFQFKIGTVLDAEPIEVSKLLKMLVDIGEPQPRTIVGGLGDWYKPDDLVGTQVVVLANLDPKELKGIMSNGMVLAADAKKKGVPVLRPSNSVPNGNHVH